MPFFLGAHILIAIACAVHVVRTGREIYWLMILFAFPGIGSIVYVITEILPGMMGSKTARSAHKAAQKALDPGREARDALHALEITRTPGHLRRAAEALIAAGRPGEALDLAQEAAQGAFAEDSAIQMTLARALFETGDMAGARDELVRLKEHHPDLRLPDGHLLYARTLEALGETDNALAAYCGAAEYYPGPEARARWALLLEQAGRADEAHQRWDEIVSAARIAPKHVRKLHRTWIDMARSRV